MSTKLVEVNTRPEDTPMSATDSLGPDFVLLETSHHSPKKSSGRYTLLVKFSMMQSLGTL